MQGSGTFTYASGAQYVGEWKANQYHGRVGNGEASSRGRLLQSEHSSEGGNGVENHIACLPCRARLHHIRHVHALQLPVLFISPASSHLINCSSQILTFSYSPSPAPQPCRVNTFGQTVDNMRVCGKKTKCTDWASTQMPQGTSGKGNSSTAVGQG